MQNEQEENNKPKFLYITSIKNVNPIEGLENSPFFTFDFEGKDNEKTEGTETPEPFTIKFDGEIPEDAIKAIMEADPVIIKGGKFYDKDMNLLYDGESIKDIKTTKK